MAWIKISELVESREFTQVEIISAVLNGKLPAYDPIGHQLELVEIIWDEKNNNMVITYGKPFLFIMGFYTTLMKI